MQGYLGRFLSVAWWSPMNLGATAQNTSLLLSLLGFLLVQSGKWMGAIIIFIGGILHPAVSLFSTLFCCIIFLNFQEIGKNKRILFFGVGATVLSSIFVKYIFSESLIDTNEFIRIYVYEGHPSHYIPKQFGQLTSLSWEVSYAINAIGLLSATIALYFQKKKFWINAFIGFFSYIFAIFLQFLFIEIYPIKAFAILGLSRFTMFGPWLLFIFGYLAISQRINNNYKIFNFVLIERLNKRFLSLLTISFVGLIFLLVVFYISRPNHLKIFDNDSQDIADFAITSTNNEAIFAFPFQFPRAIFSLKTNRGVFNGNGFPFSEKWFTEWDQRNSYINGKNTDVINMSGEWIGEKYANHYRQLKIDDFIKMSSQFKLDYVVVEINFSTYFQQCNAEFKTSKYLVFSLQELKKCNLAR